MELLDTIHVPKGNDIAYLTIKTECILSNGMYDKEVKNIRISRAEEKKIIQYEPMIPTFTQQLKRKHRLRKSRTEKNTR